MGLIAKVRNLNPYLKLRIVLAGMVVGSAIWCLWEGVWQTDHWFILAFPVLVIADVFVDIWKSTQNSGSEG